MNELEERFMYDFIDEVNNNNDLCADIQIKQQVVIGIYQVDFLVDDEFVIEIDGHESHKTKEQREHDYKRERYLMKKGHTVIRYMGTEVFLDSKGCAKEAVKMIDDIIVRRDYEDFTSCSKYYEHMKQKEAEDAKQDIERQHLRK